MPTPPLDNTNEVPGTTTLLNFLDNEIINPVNAHFADSAEHGGGGGASSLPGVWADDYSGANDSARVQAAIDDAHATNKGIVWLAPRTYAMTTPITVKSIILAGAGIRATTLQWAADGGAGVAAVTITDPATIRWSSQMRDMHIVGPGARSLGVKTSQMDGVLNQAPCIYKNVRIRQFGSGCRQEAIEGHTTWVDCNITDNYYGIHISSALGAAGADQLVMNCDINGNTFANIAVTEARGVDGIHMFRGHCGYAPYGVYQEAGTTNTPFLIDCTFHRARFESCGNGAFFTEKTGAGDRGGLQAVELVDVGFSWNDDYKIAARAKDYAFLADYCGRGLIIRSGMWPFKKGTVGAMKVRRVFAPVLIDHSGAPGGPVPADDFTFDEGESRAIRYIPGELAGHSGTAQIASGQTSLAISTTYSGPVGAIRPVVTATGTGGLASPFLYVTDVVTNAPAGTSGFTVRVSGGTPSSNLPFSWKLV
jgi:hypothetical protein